MYGDEQSAAGQSASLAADSAEHEQQVAYDPESYRSGAAPRSTTKSALDASGAVLGAGAGHESQAAMDEHRRKLREKAEQENATLWQHPFVDVFKHFKVAPGSDWKVNKRQGDVNEYFAREIGRRAIAIEGTISANNYVQTPHPQSATRSLGLTGRYCYLQVKCPRHGLAFSYHLDLGMAERSHGIRISVSNLFKNFGSSNGFVAQVPLELRNNCWSIVVLDLYEILRQSHLLPSTYLIEGSYQIRSITICANTHVRGVFTSDNLYDHVTLPADMRYKFAFDLSKWHEYFHWQMLPQDWSQRRGPNGDLVGDENLNLPNLVDQQKRKMTKEEQRLQMRQEIDDLMNTGKEVVVDEAPQESLEDLRRRKYEEMQRQLNMQFKAGPADAPVTGYTMKDEEEQQLQRRPPTGLHGMDYKGGMYSGVELERSHKLNKDPIMELQHVIGYQADKCTQVRWSHAGGESVVIFSTGGSLIAMDADTSEQKRFFFGHSAPICCFDVSRQGNMLASAQEGKRKKDDEDGKGKPALIRLWDYATARCITMTIMPVIEMQCMTFSHDGRYLACVGLDHHNKELIIVWDISRVQRGEKPEIVARHTSEFNVLEIKFNPIDPTRLASCGKENIRFWRIRDTGNIRGSAVVLNHHARNTVFTCLDFEYGFRSTDKTEAESLMRLFVGTKHGMVYIVNYQNETLEAPYKTNDAAIYSIAVNEAFCVIGSMDSYLRVWPLDFQDFFMEAQHEGIVSSVDISNDGLRVACGTMYGSIGILDKSNQGYKTLLRSHTDEILAIDYHQLKNNIITVSSDRTIRLWDLDSLEEVYEFSSPIDQPISIASHPKEAKFACGFQSGKMRIFDIEATEVLDEFSQFSEPLASLAYDNLGRFLIACCKDGSVSIHNAARQHLPVKMMQLAQPPEFVHVAFTESLPQDPDPLRNQRFAVMGENGNNIIAYDTESFLIQHQIQVNTVVKFFRFANGNRDLLVATKDCRVRFYSLHRYEGEFMREVANCHRGMLTSLDVSGNSGYMLTGGEDTLLKIWDYEAQETRSFNFQSFIGHTYALKAVMFNPKNNRQIISVGAKDGIFFWDFNGDVDSDYALPGVAGQDLQSLEVAAADPKQMSVLQQMRTQGKAAKEFRNQMREDSFYLPEFVRLEPQPREIAVEREFVDPPIIVKERRDDLKLTYNHYVGCSKRVDVEVESGAYMALTLPSIARDPKTLDQKLINGYDGFGGVHDNIAWHPTGGLTFFTLNNKLIVEETQTRKQQIFVESNNQLSCLACSLDYKFVAVGEGQQGHNGKSLLYLYNVEQRRLVKPLPFHEKGIQSLAFSPDARYLVSVGVRDDKLLVVWDVHQHIAVYYATLNDAPVNQVRVDPFASSANMLQFVTIGNNGSMTIWRCDLDQSAMQAAQIAEHKVVPDPLLANVHFCALDFTHRLPAPANAYYILIGASDGSIVAYDPQEGGVGYVDVAGRGKILEGEIGVVSVKNNLVVLGSSKGALMQYPIEGCSVYPMDSDVRFCEAAIISVHMDELNREGLVGTEAGQIFYVNFADRGDGEKPVRIISSCNHNQDAVQLVKFDSVNPNIFISACGKRSDAFTIQANENCDELRRFGSNLDEDGYVVFVLSGAQSRGSSKGARSNANRKTIGFSNGVLKRANLDTLQFQDVFKVPLNSGEKITCGFQSANDANILMGTNHGTLFIVSVQLPSKARRVEASYCRIDNVGKCNSFDNLPAGDEAAKKARHQKLNSDIINDEHAQIDGDSIDIVDSQLLDYDFIGITCVSTPSTDPIGTILVGFDDGTVRLWQNQRNDYFTKILKLKAAVKTSNLSSQPDDKLKQSIREQAAKFDIAGFGYQQFDLQDMYHVFSNPHGVDQVTEEDRLAAKAYQGKKHESLYACFPPGEQHSQKTFQLQPTTTYICIVEPLLFIYIRDFAKNEIQRRIALQHFPTCLATGEPNKWRSGEDQPYAQKESKKEPKQNYMIAVGTKEGTVDVFQVGGFNHIKLFETRAGLSYGAITALDISPNGEYIVAGTQTGEMLQYELLKKMNEDNEDE